MYRRSQQIYVITYPNTYNHTNDNALLYQVNQHSMFSKCKTHILSIQFGLTWLMHYCLLIVMLFYEGAYNGGVCQCITQSTGYATVQCCDTTTILLLYLLYTVLHHMHYGTLV
jgi:hypothetical protein